MWRNDSATGAATSAGGDQSPAHRTSWPAERIEQSPFLYDLFIAYSRRADLATVVRLQDALERAGRPWFGQRTIRVFRDDSSLAMTSDLWQSIRTALERSRYFLLIASPASAASRADGEGWATREALYFLALGAYQQERFGIVVTNGETPWTDAGKQITTAVALALVDTLRRLKREPLVIDLRPRLGEPKSAQRARFQAAIAAIAAPLMGRDKDELHGTHLRRQRLTIMSIAAAVVVLGVLTSIAGVLGLRMRENARVGRKNAAIAQERLAAAYLEQGRALLVDEQRAMRALPYLVAARAEGAEANSVLRMLVAGALAATPRVAVQHRDLVVAVAFRRNGRQFMTASGRAVQVWDALSGVPSMRPFLHPDVVIAASFSTDGERIVSVSADNIGRVWNARTGELQHEVVISVADKQSIWINPDGAFIVTSDKAFGALVWDVGSVPSEAKRLPSKGGVVDVAFGPYSSRAAMASADGTVRIWDLETASCAAEWHAHNGAIVAIAMSSDGARLVTAGTDKTVRVWDAHTGSAMASLTPSDVVCAVSFSADGMLVATGSTDGTARVWEAESGAAVTEPLEHDDAVWAVSFSPDGQLLATASNDKTARVWTATTGKPLTVPLEHRDAVLMAFFSPEGARVLTASRDRAVRVWDLDAANSTRSRIEHPDIVSAAAFSPDSTLLATASWDGIIRVFNARTGTPVVEPLDTDALATSVAFSADGEKIVTASGDRAIVWDFGAEKVLALRHYSAVSEARFSGDGLRIVTASADMTARVWEVATGKRLATLRHGDAVCDARFSADGGRIVTASSDKTARIWDAWTGKPTSDPLVHGAQVVSAAFSPDDTRVVTASYDRNVRVWDSWTGQIVSGPFEHLEAVRTAVFSPDGTRVVSASYDKTAQVWDAATGKPVTPPLEHAGAVVGVAFSPDGARIVTASHDTSARVWDARTGRALTPSLRHEGFVVVAAFAPDGASVTTASWDKSARIWELALHGGSLDDWERMARCGPFVFDNGVLLANHGPCP